MNENVKALQAARQSISTMLLGKEKVIDLCLCAFLAGGHILIEDLPGVGKTTLAKALARTLGLSFSRIQCTSDLLPADILGGNIWNGVAQNLVFQRGPINAQLVLADELNRASPRTQSACLQAMEEREVTVEGQTYVLPRPFFVVATQNPSESGGVYQLPESQLDRFLFRLTIGLPTRDTEIDLLKRGKIDSGNAGVQEVLNSEKILEMQNLVQKIEVNDRLLRYFMNVVELLRSRFDGLSPRGSLGWLNAAKSYAFLNGRNMVTPDHVQAVALATLSHRLVRRPGETELSKMYEIITETVQEVAVF